MSEETPNLRLPYIMPSQAQKHVTHNEAIRAIDALLQVGVIDHDVASPPAEPADGDRYIVGAGATGAWAGKDYMLAAFQDGAWTFFEPNAGWVAYVVGESRLLVHDGAEWRDVPVRLAPENFQNIEGVGVNSTHDATNRFAVASPASLFNNEGGGHQIKVNKNASSDTASILFQTSWSGRAEFGTTGDDNFHVKVSPDGETWNEAMQLNRSTGAVGIGNVNPVRPLHIRGNNAAVRVDRDANTVSVQLHRFPSGDYTTPWKGFTFGVESHSSGTGRFLIGDYGTAVSGPVTYRFIIENNGEVTPGEDNTQSLGVASRRWTQVYASSATINTSDENEKQDIEALPDAWLDAWGDVEWSRFRYRDAVQLKGNGARWHVGIVAQRVRNCFAARGLDAFRIGLLCYDEWDEEPETVSADGEAGEFVSRPLRAAGGRYGIRYEEALSMEAAWQRRELQRLKQARQGPEPGSAG